LRELIFAAVDIHAHMFSYPVPPKNAIWHASAVAEPGGIVLRIVPIGAKVKVSVLLHDCWMPDPEVLSADLIVGEGTVDYFDFARAVYRDAGRTVVRHGFTGLRQAWEPGRWDIDSHFEVLPIEHFLFLARLVSQGVPSYSLTFGEELELLNKIKEEFSD